MASIIDCPSCSRKLRVPDELLGQTVKCPTCQMVFDATAGPAPLPSPPTLTSGEREEMEAPPSPTAAEKARGEGQPPGEPSAPPAPETPSLPLAPALELQLRLVL